MMMPKRFSRHFPTFNNWDRQAGNTEYANSIRRLHAFYPKATLSQLRGIPRTGEKPLGRLRKVPLSQLHWDVLRPREKSERERSLQVLSMVKGGKDFLSATREVGIKPQTVLRHLGDVIVKRNGKFIAKKTDRVSRGLVIKENGEEIAIMVSDSKTASVIGRYHNAVRRALEGDASRLKPFRGVVIRDTKGRKHRLETNLRKIRDIEERKEEPEFFSIYSV